MIAYDATELTSGDSSRRPSGSGLSSRYICLLCLPLCCACSLWYRLRLAGWLPCLERASHSVLRVLSVNVLSCFVRFHSHMVSMNLYLIASIPGPSILTLKIMVNVMHEVH